MPSRSSGREAASRPEEAATRSCTPRPGLEVGVYVLVAPEPDRQQPHSDDELYVVLEGSGTLNVEGQSIPVVEGQAIFVPAGADHQFTATRV